MLAYRRYLNTFAESQNIEPCTSYINHSSSHGLMNSSFPFILHSKSIMMNAGESQWKPTRVLSVHVKLTLSLRCYQQIHKVKSSHTCTRGPTHPPGWKGRKETHPKFHEFRRWIGVIHS